MYMYMYKAGNKAGITFKTASAKMNGGSNIHSNNQEILPCLIV